MDDEPANVRMGLRMLGRMGVLAANVVQLKDGEEALEFIQAGTYADVMLLDIQMPKLTGLEVVRRAVPHPRYPIVAMTGHVDVESQEQFRLAGFQGCLCKPFDARSLGRVLQDVAAQDPAEWVSLVCFTPPPPLVFLSPVFLRCSNLTSFRLHPPPTPYCPPVWLMFVSNVCPCAVVLSFPSLLRT